MSYKKLANNSLQYDFFCYIYVCLYAYVYVFGDLVHLIESLVQYCAKKWFSITVLKILLSVS